MQNIYAELGKYSVILMFQPSPEWKLVNLLISIPVSIFGAWSFSRISFLCFYAASVATHTFGGDGCICVKSNKEISFNPGSESCMAHFFVVGFGPRRPFVRLVFNVVLVWLCFIWEVFLLLAPISRAREPLITVGILRHATSPSHENTKKWGQDLFWW